MTVLMTFIGTFVFFFSWPRSGFKTAWKRLMTFATTGVIIDAFIIGISLLVTYAIAL